MLLLPFDSFLTTELETIPMASAITKNSRNISILNKLKNTNSIVAIVVPTDIFMKQIARNQCS